MLSSRSILTAHRHAHARSQGLIEKAPKPGHLRLESLMLSAAHRLVVLRAGDVGGLAVGEEAAARPSGASRAAWPLDFDRARARDLGGGSARGGLEPKLAVWSRGISKRDPRLRSRQLEAGAALWHWLGRWLRKWLRRWLRKWRGRWLRSAREDLARDRRLVGGRGGPLKAVARPDRPSAWVGALEPPTQVTVDRVRSERPQRGGTCRIRVPRERARP